MIADAIPPFPTLLLILGAVLTLLGLTGQISIKEAKLGIPQPSLRVLAGVIGIAFVGVAIWILVFPATVASDQKVPSSPPQTAPVPAPTPESSIPNERYKELTGTWSVTEKVQPKFGGYEIIWNYTATVVGKQLTLRGKKTVVNEPGQTAQRKLTDEEKRTDSVCILFLAGLRAEGTFEEKSPRETLAGTIKLHFADDLHSFAGTAETGGEETSTFMGARK